MFKVYDINNTKFVTQYFFGESCAEEPPVLGNTVTSGTTVHSQGSNQVDRGDNVRHRGIYRGGELPPHAIKGYTKNGRPIRKYGYSTVDEMYPT